MESVSGSDVSHLPIDPDLDLECEDRRFASSERRPSHRAHLAILLAVGFGGMVGALARYAVSVAVPAPAGHFPWGTFLINVSGSAVLGFLLVLMIEQFPRGRLIRPVIGTGVVGAYTTFSTYLVEAVLLIRSGHADIAVIYLLASALAGLLAVWLGMTAARGAVSVERWLQEESP